MEDPLTTNGGTHGDVAPALPGDVHDGPLADDVPAPTSGFCQIEPSFIYVDVLMLLRCRIEGQDSLTEHAYTKMSLLCS